MKNQYEFIGVCESIRDTGYDMQIELQHIKDSIKKNAKTKTGDLIKITNKLAVEVGKLVEMLEQTGK